MQPPLSIEQTINLTVREEWGRILASLTASIGNLQLAEDCLQESVISAMQHWKKNGLPTSPAAWLITTARRKAIDHIRRDKNFASKQNEIAYLLELENEPESEQPLIADKRLEMIFTCCHPALDEKTKLALTLRTLGGLTTQEIATAFLDKKDAMAQRLVRAKQKISKANIPYKIPGASELPERISSVLSVVYLIFNEGYSATSGESLVRANLCEEAIRLARILKILLPHETEISGLLALMLLHDSRRNTRTDWQGEMVSLEKQNRARWDKAKIFEGTQILKETLPKKKIGPYQLQAAISAIHAESSNWEETDWKQIAALYNLLYSIEPSPIIKINYAVAMSYAQSVECGLEIFIQIQHSGKLENYQPFHAAHADLLARSEKDDEAEISYNKAIALSENRLEKLFLQAKLSKLKQRKLH